MFKVLVLKKSTFFKNSKKLQKNSNVQCFFLHFVPSEIGEWGCSLLEISMNPLLFAVGCGILHFILDANHMIFQGKVAILVDDMADTCGTICLAADK